MVKDKTYIRFHPKSFLCSSSTPPNSLLGRDGHQEGSQDLVLWDQRPDPYLLYLNTVIGLGQREQLTVMSGTPNSFVSRTTVTQLRTSLGWFQRGHKEEELL